MICGESSKELNKIWLAVLIRAVFLFVLYMGYTLPTHLTMYNQSQGQMDFGRFILNSREGLSGDLIVFQRFIYNGWFQTLFLQILKSLNFKIQT